MQHGLHILPVNAQITPVVYVLSSNSMSKRTVHSNEQKPPPFVVMARRCHSLTTAVCGMQQAPPAGLQHHMVLMSLHI